MEAKVARIYTDKANSIGVRMEKIFDLIRKSADSGLDFLILDGLDRDCKENLEDLGYRVYEDKSMNHITIEW